MFFSIFPYNQSNKQNLSRIIIWYSNDSYTQKFFTRGVEFLSFCNEVKSFLNCYQVLSIKQYNSFKVLLFYAMILKAVINKSLMLTLFIILFISCFHSTNIRYKLSRQVSVRYFWWTQYCKTVSLYFLYFVLEHIISTDLSISCKSCQWKI